MLAVNGRARSTAGREGGLGGPRCRVVGMPIAAVTCEPSQGEDAHHAATTPAHVQVKTSEPTDDGHNRDWFWRPSKTRSSSAAAVESEWRLFVFFLLFVFIFTPVFVFAVGELWLYFCIIFRNQVSDCVPPRLFGLRARFSLLSFIYLDIGSVIFGVVGERIPFCKKVARRTMSLCWRKMYPSAGMNAAAAAAVAAARHPVSYSVTRFHDGHWPTTIIFGRRLRLNLEVMLT